MAMALPTWPESLRAFSTEDYSINADGRGVLRTGLSGGPIRQRRRYRNRDRTVPCSMKCTASQAITFKHFFDEQIDEGANPFNGVWEDPLGRQSGVVRIQGGSMSVTRMDGTDGWWRVAVVLEIEDDMTSKHPVAVFVASLKETDAEDIDSVLDELADAVSGNAL